MLRPFHLSPHSVISSAAAFALFKHLSLSVSPPTNPQTFGCKRIRLHAFPLLDPLLGKLAFRIIRRTYMSRKRLREGIMPSMGEDETGGYL